jgi:small multidrug resistance pump
MLGALPLLLVAIGVEVAATAALPHTQSFRAPLWTALVLGGYGVSIWLLAVVVKHMQVSVAYAIWSGVGTAAIALVGVVMLGESWDLTKALALSMIVVGVVVLNLHVAH